MISASVELKLDLLPALKSGVKNAMADLLTVGIEAWDNDVDRSVTEEAKHGRMYGEHQASAPGEPWASDTDELRQAKFIDKTHIRATIDPRAIGGWKDKAAEIAAAHEFGRRDGTESPRPTAIPALQAAKDAVLEAAAEVEANLTYLGSKSAA
jgi:hypothetical protein